MSRVPGIQYPSDLGNLPVQLQQVVRNIYDNLFYIRGTLTTPTPLTQAQINQIEKQLINQIINSVTNNVTNNITNIGFFIVGTHNVRITVYGPASQPVGTAFFETDRNVFYVITDFPKKWTFGAGVMVADLSSRPSDLGANDKGFLFFDSTGMTLFIWDGSAWDTISGGGGGGYWTPVTNGDGSAPELVFDSNGNVVMVFVPV